MGKMMGAFDRDNDMLDRPDLNKCPDCGCFFAQDNCPLCGKPCPEDMRAGNRAAPKKQKYKYDNGFKAVQFVDWYHRWWFIALATFFFPLVGIVLFITSPHKKKHKIIAIIIAVLYWIVSYFAIPYLWAVINAPEYPVDNSLSREEYVVECQTVPLSDYYRNPNDYNDKFICMELTVKSRFYSEEYLPALFSPTFKQVTHYICTDERGELEIIVSDYLVDSSQNFIPGDKITVYGEGGGNGTIYDLDANSYTAPILNMAYADLLK